jgi:hypothetical protein
VEPVAAPTPPERVALVAGVLLVAALTLLPWYSTGPVPSPRGSPGRTAIQQPGALLGIGATLMAATAVAWLALATLVPRAPVPHPGRAGLALAVAALAFVVAKLLAQTEDLASGAWCSLVLCVVLIGNEVVVRALDQDGQVSASG